MNGLEQMAREARKDHEEGQTLPICGKEQVTIDYDRWLYLEGVARCLAEWRKSLEGRSFLRVNQGDVGPLIMAGNRLDLIERDNRVNGERLTARHEEMMLKSAEEILRHPSAPRSRRRPL